MLLQPGAFFGGQFRRDRAQFIAHFIQHTAEVFPVLHLPVQFLKKLIRITHRRDWLIRPRVRPSRPRVRTMRHIHADFQRAKPRRRRRILLQKIAQLLVDRNPPRPARRLIAAALDVAGKKLNAREQATHPAHVPIAIAANFVRDSLQRQRPTFERLQRREDALERKILPHFIRPEIRLHHPIGREHKDDPLRLRPHRPERRHSRQKRKHRSGDARVTKKLATSDDHKIERAGTTRKRAPAWRGSWSFAH